MGERNLRHRRLDHGSRNNSGMCHIHDTNILGHVSENRGVYSPTPALDDLGRPGCLFRVPPPRHHTVDHGSC